MLFDSLFFFLRLSSAQSAERCHPAQSKLLWCVCPCVCDCIYFILIGLLLFAGCFLLARFVCDKRLGRCNAVVVVVIINGPTHTHRYKHMQLQSLFTSRSHVSLVCLCVCVCDLSLLVLLFLCCCLCCCY